MNAHVLFARCPDGSVLEIGGIGSAQTAARILRALEHELGDEYVAFWVLEEEAAPITGRSLTYDELRPRSLGAAGGSPAQARASRH